MKDACVGTDQKSEEKPLNVKQIFSKRQLSRDEYRLKIETRRFSQFTEK